MILEGTFYYYGYWMSKNFLLRLPLLLFPSFFAAPPCYFWIFLIVAVDEVWRAFFSYASPS